MASIGINKMLILEPFPYGTGDRKKALDFDWLADDGGEANILPVAGATTTTGKAWLAHDQVANDPDGTYIAFRKYFEDYEYSIFYVVSYIYFPTARTVRLLISSDDGCKIWWNGAPVYTHYDARSIDTKNPDHVDVEAIAGKNRFMIKVQNVSSHTGFRVICGKSSTEEYTDVQYGIEPPIQVEVTPDQAEQEQQTTQQTTTQQTTQTTQPTTGQYVLYTDPTTGETSYYFVPTSSSTSTPSASSTSSGTAFLDDIANQIGIEKEWLIVAAVGLALIVLFM